MPPTQLLRDARYVSCEAAAECVYSQLWHKLSSDILETLVAQLFMDRFLVSVGKIGADMQLT